jgi:hypothetical protein
MWRLLCCISLAWSGAVWAQNTPGPGAAVNHLQGAEMSVTLSQTVDARKAKPGDAVTATLTEDVRANGRLLLLRGTTLVGRVTEAQPKGRRAESGDAPADSRLGIEFESAVLRDGQEMPINATIQAVAAGEPAAASNARDAASDDPAARGPLTSGARGVFGLAGVQIMTAAGDGTTVLVSSTGNVSLKSGTQLMLIARGDATADQPSASPTVGHESGSSTQPLGSKGS